MNGKPSHTKILSFGYIPKDRLPYLRAAFNEGNPDEILKRELAKMEESNK